MEEKTKPEEILVPGLEVETVKGVKFRVPKTTLKKEIEIGRVLVRILASLYSSEVIKKGDFSVGEIVNELPNLVAKVPDDFVKIASIIVEKEEGWVLENLEIEGLIKILTPFFSKFKRLGKILTPLVPRARVSTK